MNIIKNILSKTPSILIIILILFALSIFNKKFFGNEFAPFSANESTEELSEILPENYNIDSLNSLLPNSYNILKINNVWYQIDDENGDKTGYILCGIDYSSKVYGYGGTTPVSIVLDKNLVIKKVLLLKNSETERFLKSAVDGGLFEAWNGVSLGDIFAFNVDVITRATMTSNAVISNVGITAEQAIKALPTSVSLSDIKSHNKNKTVDFVEIIKDICTILVIIFSLISYFKPSMFSKFRPLLLISSILVIGVWQGSFISLSQLYAWFINGVSWSGRVIPILIVLFAILLPLFLNKSYYCTYLCPFGAAQELMSKISKKRVKLPINIIKILSKLGRYYLLTLLVLITVGINIDLADFEPFTIFMINSVSLSVIIIAIVSLILSIFVPRAWCRFMCPTGALLNTLTKASKTK